MASRLWKQMTSKGIARNSYPFASRNIVEQIETA